MKKSKVILSMLIALSVSITGAGCGTKNSNTVENQKEVAVNDTDNKKTEKQESVVKVSEKVNEVPGIKEEIITEDEKADTQQAEASAGDVATTTNKNNSNTSSNGTGTSSGNARNNTGNSASGGNSATSSGNTSSGGNNSNSGSGANNNSGNSTSGSSTNSNSNNNTDNNALSQPEHTHNWVHHEATGHYETVTIQAAWDEEIPVYEEKARTVCNQCGVDITGNVDAHLKANIETCWAYHIEYIQVQTGTQTVHHDAVTEQRWSQDSPAYDVCSGCGATK